MSNLVGLLDAASGRPRMWVGLYFYDSWGLVYYPYCVHTDHSNWLLTKHSSGHIQKLLFVLCVSVNRSLWSVMTSCCVVP